MIVVAQWDKAPIRPAAKGGPVGFRTELTVLRTIKEWITPGKHDVFITCGRSWNEDGTPVEPGSAAPLEVDDVSKPNLWFLQHHLTSERGPPRAAWAVLSIGIPLLISAAFLAVLCVRYKKRLRVAVAALVIGLSCVVMARVCSSGAVAATWHHADPFEYSVPSRRGLVHQHFW